MWQHMFSMPVMRTVWRRELDLHGETVKLTTNTLYRIVLNYAGIFQTFTETVWDFETHSVTQPRNLDTNVC